MANAESIEPRALDREGRRIEEWLISSMTLCIDSEAVWDEELLLIEAVQLYPMKVDHAMAE